MSGNGGRYRFYSSYAQDQHPFNVSRPHFEMDDMSRPKSERPGLYLFVRIFAILLFLAGICLTSAGVANNAEVTNTGLVVLPILAPVIAITFTFLDIFWLRNRHLKSSLLCDLLLWPLLVVPCILLLFTTTIASNMVKKEKDRDARKQNTQTGDTLMAFGCFVIIFGANAALACAIYNLVRIMRIRRERKHIGYQPPRSESQTTDRSNGMVWRSDSQMTERSNGRVWRG